MPYIPSDDRQKYNESLKKILAQLSLCDEESLGGELNYCISFLLFQLFKLKGRYVRANTLIGALESAKQEFYRRLVAPYESHKIIDNGDV